MSFKQYPACYHLGDVIKVTDLTKANSFETFQRLKLPPSYLYGSLNR
ncbi:hypothetical protein HXA32_17225 [Salipaludibacillus agaradhaerens]|nr:hypothetical protein [Salipaludibacillus agaradhaerens]MCR6108014.1 hypothetical protein [Salipaludibacillus agaradhaerens]UJW59092.1 hypothetical protein HXZ66_17595 [Bacillus sp. A116_S68]